MYMIITTNVTSTRSCGEHWSPAEGRKHLFMSTKCSKTEIVEKRKTESVYISTCALSVHIETESFCVD